MKQNLCSDVMISISEAINVFDVIAHRLLSASS